MAMSYAIYDLLKDPSCLEFVKAPTFLNVLKQVTSTCVLHHHEKVFRRLKDLKKPDDVSMSDLFQDLNFL